MDMGNVIIDSGRLSEALRVSREIENALGNTYDESSKLVSFVQSAQWKGKSKDAFQAFIDLVNQYHKDMHEVLKKHTNALDNLEKHIQDFNNENEVRQVKNL